MGLLFRWKQGVETLDVMREKLIQHNVITVGSIMNSLEQDSSRRTGGKAWLRVVALLADSRCPAGASGLVLLNTVLASLSNSGRWQHSMGVLQEVAWKLAETDVISWNSAIAASQLSWTNALLCMEALQMTSSICDAISFNSAIQCCSTVTQWQQMLGCYEVYN